MWPMAAEQLSSYSSRTGACGGVDGADGMDGVNGTDGFYGAAGIRIAGGTDEILKNIISEQVLGMPQDMRADKGLPFNEIPTGNK